MSTGAPYSRSTARAVAATLRACASLSEGAATSAGGTGVAPGPARNQRDLLVFLADHPLAQAAIEGGGEGIGRDITGYDRFAQPPRGVDEHLVGRACHRVFREGDAARAGAYHLHDDDRHRLARVLDAAEGAVVHGALMPEAAVAVERRAQDRVRAAQVEEALVEAGERGAGAVFVEAAGSGGEGRIRSRARLQLCAGLRDGGLRGLV